MSNECLYIDPAILEKITQYRKRIGSDPSEEYSAGFIFKILRAFNMNPEKAAEMHNKAAQKMFELAFRYADDELVYVEKPISKHIWKHFETAEEACNYLDDLYERSLTKASVVLEKEFFDYVDKQNEIYEPLYGSA